jgi:hypothetical protein
VAGRIDEMFLVRGVEPESVVAAVARGSRNGLGLCCTLAEHRTRRA